MRLIAFVGLQGSGKDTAAQFFIDRGFQGLSFADPLKDLLSFVFGWSRESLEGDTEASRAFRETVDPWWAARLDRPDFTPRWAMKNIGTEVMRRHFHPDLWTLSMERRLARVTAPAGAVLRDCRFANEIALARRHGATVVRLRRGGDPAWMADAIAANLGSAYHRQRMTELHRVHESEWAWAGSPVDLLVTNDGSIADLRARLHTLLG